MLYKRYTQQVILIIGVVLAVLFNADTIMMINRLQHDTALRNAIVAQAQQTAQKEEPNAAGVHTFAKTEGDLEALNLIGWDFHTPGSARGLYTLPREAKAGDIVDLVFWGLLKLLGLLVTGFAVSRGAPFWFDFLNKLLSVRQSQGQAKSQDSAAPVAK